ncbi:hypothetical protein ALC62_00527 [Cyphomyrmex costatus]|uniref:Uncharacterized protein n=1 Tax=Cyphomyrmex costatus TaxID=456900 RepID=A0A195D6P2_9HYME|nr:hypothetical protein ALC62_00527 [Cyphomyrmex costatus]
MKWCVLVLVFAGLTRGDNAIDTNNIFNCPELNAQDEIDLDKVCVCCRYRRLLSFRKHDRNNGAMKISIYTPA